MDKQEEYEYLLYFKEKYPSFPSGEIIHSESPDFIILGDDKKYGIELSALYQKATKFGIEIQAVDSMTDSIIGQVENQLNTLTIPFIDVSIHFTLHKRLTKKQRDVLIHKIVDLVVINLPKTDSGIHINNDYENKNVFPWEIDFISILNYSQMQFHHVHTWKSGWVQSEMTNELQHAIDKKK